MQGWPCRQRDRDLALMLPADQTLVETDGPWPYGGQFAGRLTEPAMIKEVVAAIAHLRCTTFEEIAATTTSNTRALFRIGERTESSLEYARADLRISLRQVPADHQRPDHAHQ